MLILTILSIIDVILMFVVNPWNIITWTSVFTTATFILRRINVIVKVEKVMMIECLIAFVAISGSFVFKTFSLKTYALMTLIRLFQYALIYYDDITYVYVSEEHEEEL